MLNLVHNYRKYGSNPSSHDLVKIMALILMVIDHLGHFFFPEQVMWRSVGRWCVPMWLFLIGYATPKQLISRDLIILAILLVIIDIVTYNPPFPATILFSIFFSRLFIHYIAQK